MPMLTNRPQVQASYGVRCHVIDRDKKGGSCGLELTYTIPYSILYEELDRLDRQKMKVLSCVATTQPTSPAEYWAKMGLATYFIRRIEYDKAQLALDGFIR